MTSTSPRPLPTIIGQRQTVSCWVTVLACLAALWANSLTDAEVDEVSAGFEARRDAYLGEYLTKPLYEFDWGIEVCRSELKRAQWIWHPEEGATSLAPIGTRHFRRMLVISPERSVKKAYCAFAADNYGDVLVNGQKVGRASGFQHATPVDITRRMTSGENVVAITAHNAGDSPNPAGVLGLVHLEFEDGETQVVYTDDTWHSSAALIPDWSTTSTNTTVWAEVQVLGAAGSAPWGKTSLRLDVRVNQFVFSRLTFALAAFHFDADTTRANAAILDAIAQVQAERQSSGEFGLHWMGGAFYRVYGLFGPGGTREGPMSTEVAEGIWQLFADWAQSACKIADANPEHVWRLWGSENHSAQRDATAWAAARMIAADPRGASFRYEDSSTATEQLAEWRAYLKRFYRERLKRGMLVEISPSGYGSRTLQGWHNIHDFTDDPELKYLVKSALDLWWADWAQEQLDGMRGGGKTRLYPGAWALSGHDRNRAMSWFYLGQGPPAHHHETLPIIAATNYRLPPVVIDIALDPEGRGVYETKSRRLGRHLDYAQSQALSRPNEPVYEVDPEYGGLVRYAYCTPDFIAGTLMLESRPIEYWTAISQQNRWHGIIFAGDRDSTLYPRCKTDRSTYNGQWAIQNKGTLITQKLRHADHAGAMRVCFSTDLKRHENGGWHFIQAASAFAAVKIVRGGWEWDDERWLRCEDEYTPIIFEVVRDVDYGNDFQAFESAILAQDVQLDEGVLRYRGLGKTGDFTFFSTNDRLPELNGNPIGLRPDYAFQSPFVNEAWASGLVRISKGGRKLTIDVREN